MVGQGRLDWSASFHAGAWGLLIFLYRVKDDSSGELSWISIAPLNNRGQSRHDSPRQRRQRARAQVAGRERARRPVAQAALAAARRAPSISSCGPATGIAFPSSLKACGAPEGSRSRRWRISLGYRATRFPIWSVMKITATPWQIRAFLLSTAWHLPLRWSRRCFCRPRSPGTRRRTLCHFRRSTWLSGGGA